MLSLTATTHPTPSSCLPVSSWLQQSSSGDWQSMGLSQAVSLPPILTTSQCHGRSGHYVQGIQSLHYRCDGSHCKHTAGTSWLSCSSCFFQTITSTELGQPCSMAPMWFNTQKFQPRDSLHAHALHQGLTFKVPISSAPKTQKKKSSFDFSRLGQLPSREHQHTSIRSQSFIGNRSNISNFESFATRRHDRRGSRGWGRTASRKWGVGGCSPRRLLPSLLVDCRDSRVLDSRVLLEWDKVPHITHNPVFFQTTNIVKDLQAAIDCLLKKGAIEEIFKQLALGSMSTWKTGWSGWICSPTPISMWITSSRSFSTLDGLWIPTSVNSHLFRSSKVLV